VPTTRRITQRLAREDGVTVIEYALIAAMIFVVIVAALRTIGGETCKPFETVAKEMAK
jgi:Flp pilus assembly pilin Flp